MTHPSLVTNPDDQADQMRYGPCGWRWHQLFNTRRFMQGYPSRRSIMIGPEGLHWHDYARGFCFIWRSRWIRGRIQALDPGSEETRRWHVRRFPPERQQSELNHRRAYHRLAYQWQQYAESHTSSPVKLNDAH